MACGTGLISFLLYLSCLSPTVTYTGDCGELISASYRLGITHPSGYALLCLLGRTFASIFPFGEVAFRYNLLSAILCSVAIGLVAATVHRLTVGTDGMRRESGPLPWYRGAPALASGLLLAGFYEFWTQAVIAEVSGLEAINETAALYCAIAWHQEDDYRWAYACAFFFGLAIISHLTSIFLLPGLFLYVLWQHRARWRNPPSAKWRRLATLVALPMLAYSLMIYLPLRSALFPEPIPPTNWTPLDWTHPVDLHRFLQHVTAQQYKVHLIKWTPESVGPLTLKFPSFVAPLATLPARIEGFVLEMCDLYLWSIVFVVAGTWLSFAPRRAFADPADEVARRTGGRWLGWMLAAVTIGNVGMEINYVVGDQTNFFFPAYICLAIWLGLGLAWAFGALERWAINRDELLPRPLWRWRCTTFAWILYLGTAITCQWAIYFDVVSLHGNTFARDAALERTRAARELYKKTGRSPILFLMEDDGLWGFWYAHFVLNQPPGPRPGQVLPIVTPYGLYRNSLDDSGHLADWIADEQKIGPVAISKYETAIDQRFPYRIVTPSGNLCEVTTNALPDPATPLANPGTFEGPQGLLAAYYRRSALACSEVPDPAQLDLAGYTPQSRQFLKVNKVVSLKGNDLSAFEVHFVCTDALRRAADAGPRDNRSHSARAGWIEVLMAKHGFLKGTPPPDQPDVSLPDADIPLRVWRERRRLVLPDAARPGTAWAQTVPMQIDMNAISGGYTVWARIVTDPADRTTPWTWTDLAFVTEQ